jgi:2-C-methyl-D-erythritol 4-phosphate cytidylyltransferase
MNIAVILSAGSGSRFGSNIPKQFINLAGKNIIEYTISAFEQNSLIDEICIVADSKFHQKLWDISVSSNFKKVKQIIIGGEERKDSSYQAIKAYENMKNINLIFHDGVRPFVSQKIITDTVKALQTYNAIDVAIPTADTIIKVDKKTNTIESIPKRDELQRGQTPQAFRLETIQKAHQLSNEDKNEVIFTDDCGLVKQYLKDEKVYVVNGEEKNIKITYKEDLLFAEKLLQIQSTTVSPKNYKKLENKVIIIFGGFSGIGKQITKIASKYNAKVESFSRYNNSDITDIKDIKKALKYTYKKYKKIDIIINTSAVLTKKELKDMTKKDIQNEINTNFTASVNISKYSYKYLKKSQGSLILFTSSSYTKGRAGYSLYSSTKAAIVNFSEAISNEWQKDKIRVNVINPSRTATKMRRTYFGKEDKTTLLKPKKVANTTLNTILSNYSGLVIDVKL